MIISKPTNNNAVVLDCQVGIGLPPLVNGVTKGEIELRTTRLTIFNTLDISEEGDPNKNNTSKNRYKKNAKGLGKRSGRNFDSNKIEEEEEIADEVSYKVRSIWWGEVGHGSLFKPDLIRIDPPISSLKEVTTPLVPPQAAPQVTRITSANRVLYPLRSKWQSIRSYCKDANEQGVRFDIIDEKTLKIVATGNLNLNTLDRVCDENNILAVRSSIKLYDSDCHTHDNNSNNKNSGSDTDVGNEKIIGSLDVTLVVRLGQHSLFEKALTAVEKKVILEQTKKLEIINIKANHESHRSTLLLPSMLSEFELNEVVAKNDCNNLLPASPMSQTEMFHPQNNMMANNSKSNLRSSWADVDAIFMEGKTATNIFAEEQDNNNNNKCKDNMGRKSRNRPLRVVEVGKKELKERVRQHFNARNNKYNKINNNSKNKRKIRKSDNRKPTNITENANYSNNKNVNSGINTPQNAIRGITNATSNVTTGVNNGVEEVERKLKYLQNHISNNEVNNLLSIREYPESKELENVTIKAGDGETMSILETLLNRAEALRETMDTASPVVASKYNHNFDNNNNPNAPLPNIVVVGDRIDDTNPANPFQATVVPPALNAGILDALIEVPQESNITDKDLEDLIQLTGESQNGSLFDKLGSSMKEALLNVNRLNIKIDRIVILGSKDISPRTMKTMVWFTNITIPKSIVNLPESKAQYQFSVHGSLAERLSNGTYALSSNSDKTIFCNVSETNFNEWLNNKLEIRIESCDDNRSNNKKGTKKHKHNNQKNSKIPGVDDNDEKVFHAAVALSQLVLSRNKPVQLAVPLQSVTGSLGGFVDIMLTLNESTIDGGNNTGENISDITKFNIASALSDDDRVNEDENRLYIPPNTISNHTKIEIEIFRCKLYNNNDGILATNEDSKDTHRAIRIIHRPWQAGVINHGSFPWTEESYGTYINDDNYIFSHRSVSTVNLPLEAGEDLTASVYIIEVWSKDTLSGLVKVPLDKMSFVGESIAGNHIDMIAVYNGALPVVDPFSGVKTGEMRLEINVGKAGSIRKNWAKKLFAACCISNFFQRKSSTTRPDLEETLPKKHNDNENAEVGNFDGLSNHLENQNMPKQEVGSFVSRKHSFNISLKTIRGRDGETAMKDQTMPSFVRYSFPFDFPGSNGGITTLWWDPSDSEYSSTSVHTIVIGNMVQNEKKYFSKIFEENKMDDVLELELWSWVDRHNGVNNIKNQDGDEGKEIALPTCCIIGVAEIPVAEFLGFLDNSTGKIKGNNSSKIVEYPVFPNKQGTWDEAMAFIQINISHQVKTIGGISNVLTNVAEIEMVDIHTSERRNTASPITLVETSTTTKNMLPAKAKLIVSFGNFIFETPTYDKAIMLISYTVFTGFGDIWKTNEVIVDIGNTALGIESSIPLEITEDLIKYLAAGEIEFLIYRKTNENIHIGSAVVPLSSFLEETAGISGVFPINASDVNSIGKLTISIFFEHHRVHRQAFEPLQRAIDYNEVTGNGKGNVGGDDDDEIENNDDIAEVNVPYPLPIIDVNFDVKDVEDVTNVPTVDANIEGNMNENSNKNSSNTIASNGKKFVGRDDNIGLTTVTFTVYNAQGIAAGEGIEKSDSFLYLSYKWDELSPTLMTHLVSYVENPSWNYSNDVKLVTQELQNCNLMEKAMIFTIWSRSSLRDGSNLDNKSNDLESEVPLNILKGGVYAPASLEGDKFIGVVRMELCVVAAGMTEVNGWYNIQNLKEESIGYIKLGFKINGGKFIEGMSIKKRGRAMRVISKLEEVPSFKEPSILEIDATDGHDNNMASHLLPTKSVADVLKKINEAKSHINNVNFNRKDKNDNDVSTFNDLNRWTTNNSLESKIQTPRGIHTSRSMEDVLHSIGQIHNHIGNLNNKEDRICKNTTNAVPKLNENEAIGLPLTSPVAPSLENQISDEVKPSVPVEEIEVDMYLDDDFEEIEDGSEEEEESLDSSQALLKSEDDKQETEMVDFKDRKTRLISEGFEMVPLQNVRDTNKMVEVESVVEPEIIVEQVLENWFETVIEKIVEETDGKGAILEEDVENNVGENKKKNSWERVPMPVVVDDLPDAKPIGKVTDSYILYMVEKAKRERHEKIKIHDQLNPPPNIQKHPDDLQKRKLSIGLPSRSPTSTLPILKSTSSPTNKMSDHPQLHATEEERRTLTSMTQRNVLLWDSAETRRIKRILKGTDGDDSSVMSSSFDSTTSFSSTI